MIQYIKAWFKTKRRNFMMTEDEKFLAASVDLADLERRQRELMYGKNRFNSFTGVTHYNTIKH
jgi:hypothetical protein